MGMNALTFHAAIYLQPLSFFYTSCKTYKVCMWEVNVNVPVLAEWRMYSEGMKICKSIFDTLIEVGLVQMIKKSYFCWIFIRQNGG